MSHCWYWTWRNILRQNKAGKNFRMANNVRINFNFYLGIFWMNLMLFSHHSGMKNVKWNENRRIRINEFNLKISTDVSGFMKLYCWGWSSFQILFLNLLHYRARLKKYIYMCSYFCIFIFCFSCSYLLAHSQFIFSSISQHFSFSFSSRQTHLFLLCQ